MWAFLRAGSAFVVCKLSLDLCVDFSKGQLAAGVKCLTVDLPVDFVSEVYLRKRLHDLTFAMKMLSWFHNARALQDRRASRFLLPSVRSVSD